MTEWREAYQVSSHERGYRSGAEYAALDRRLGDSVQHMRWKLDLYRACNGGGPWMEGWYAGYEAGIPDDEQVAI